VEHPVRGVDVSRYQGEIDWQLLSEQNIDFAFIKATEGSTYIDEKFKYNWTQARKTQLSVGAYHFFSYDTEGQVQAQNFINVVPREAEALPPVVDIEFYGDKEQNLPEKGQTQEILTDLLEALENHYGKKPIIYATRKSYDLYIDGSYDEYPLWIRDVLRKPELKGQRQWTFWQYSHRAKIKGYKGQEQYIDMNVYRGTRQEWEDFLK
jgi:lysozyme